MNDLSLREQLIRTARLLNSTGLTHGNSGNVSARVDGGVLVTPTGLPYETLQPSDLVLLAPDGMPHPGQRRPTSEWRIHVDLYAALPEAQAVVHAHPLNATALSMHRRGLPAAHYMVAVAGGADVRCADYATFGTPELSQNVLRALDGRKACLMANHGLVAYGRDLDQAFAIAAEVENVAAQYLRACQLGPPVILDDAEMARVVEAFRTYGQQA